MIRGVNLSLVFIGDSLFYLNLEALFYFMNFQLFKMRTFALLFLVVRQVMAFRLKYLIHD